MQTVGPRQILKWQAAENELQARTRIPGLLGDRAEGINTEGTISEHLVSVPNHSRPILANERICTKFPYGRAGGPHKGAHFTLGHTPQFILETATKRTNRDPVKSWDFRMGQDQYARGDTVAYPRLHAFHRSGNGIQRVTQRPESYCYFGPKAPEQGSRSGGPPVVQKACWDSRADRSNCWSVLVG